MIKDKKYSKYMGKKKMKNYKLINIDGFSYINIQKYISIIKYFFIKIIVFLNNININVLGKNKFFKQFTNLVNYPNDEKIAVYTCIFGNYDNIIEPKVFPDNIDYYIITDLEVHKDSKWKKIDLEQFKDLNYTSIEKNRYFKIFPYNIFKSYKYSIYIDGNIEIVSDLSEYINNINNYGVALHKHTKRDCVYEEIDTCIQKGKGNKKFLEEYKKKLSYEGMPRHYGLLEAPIIARNHESEIGKEIMKDWWNEFYNNKTNRDQLSLPYVLWKKSIKVKEISTLGENLYRNYSIRKVSHIN